MKKFFKITGIIFGVLVFLASSFLAIWFLWPCYGEFYDNANAEFSIPGLETEFVPQAFTKVDSKNYYIIGGYMDDKTPSRYYLIDTETLQTIKYVTLTFGEKDYVGHACGIASSGDNLWTCSNEGEGGQAFRFSLNDFLNAENGGKILIKDSFKTNNGADNIFVSNNMLWIGEFYKEEKYETDLSHHIKTRSGEINMAVAFGYELNSSNSNGLQDEIPDKALSLPKLVQGMERTENGEFVLSLSFSLAESNINSYINVLNEEKHSTILVGGNEIDLWFLDGKSLIKSIIAPSMTEEIVIYNNKLFILNESNCKKWKIFTRDRIKDVYSLPLTYILEK